jgi:low affinity Fe/Cu permease
MRFSQVCDRIVSHLESPWAFAISLVAYPAWWIWGDDVINVVTLLSFNLLFVVLNTSGRSSTATHLKLDVIIQRTPEYPNEVVGAEEKDEQEIKELRKL